MKSFILSSSLLSSLALAQGQMPLYSTYSFDPLKHLSGIAPYFEPADPPRDPSPPQGCSVTRAAYLVRHAAINANDFDYETYLQPFLEKLGNDTTTDWSKIPALAFLSTWAPPSFGEQELLTRTGKLEAATLAVSMTYRYPGFRLPQRVWTSTAERTVETAKGLVRGLEPDDDTTINIVQVAQGKKEGADSLTPYSSCAGYDGESGSDQQSEYIDRYTAPIISRLNALAPSFNFTADDVTGMQELCGYDTVIRGSSPFCSLALFSPDEWLAFEYAQDIHYHYSIGYGTPYAGVFGFPWLNATAALLTADTAEQDLYVSVTHRELPPGVLVAMGLFNNSAFSGANDPNATFPLDQINYNRAWVSSYILPFLTNVAVERMNCSASYGFTAGANTTNGTDTPPAATTFYRVLVNQSPQVLPGCADGPGQSCSASGFQDFIGQRAELFGGYSQRCGNTYDNSTDTISFYTNSNNGTTVSRRGARWLR